MNAGEMSGNFTGSSGKMTSRECHFAVENLVRENVRRLSPYTSARHQHKKGDGLLFDANENGFGSVVTAPFPLTLNRYPDPDVTSLKKKLARFLKVKPEQLFVGVGSDEIIDLLIRVFVSPDEAILTFDPTYGMYRVSGDISGVGVKSCPLDENFQMDLNVFEQTVSDKTKLVFCCSPNNPTGNLLDETAIESLCKRFRGIVAVDQAYVEFSSGSNLIKKLDALPNLVILRTFSKAWGLAGLRVGYAVTSPEIVGYLNKIKPPYNMNVVSAYLAEKALKNQKRFNRWRKIILQERKKMAIQLQKLGFKVFPSDANFILFKTENAPQAAKSLVDKSKIIIRDFSKKPGLENCLRVTVGKPADNARFLAAIARLRRARKMP